MPTLLVKQGTKGSHPTLIMVDGKFACECCGEPAVDCDANCGGNEPNYITFTISGMSGTAGAEDLSQFNGQYTLSFTPGYYCVWLVFFKSGWTYFPSTYGSDIYAQASYVSVSPGVYRIVIRFKKFEGIHFNDRNNYLVGNSFDFSGDCRGAVGASKPTIGAVGLGSGGTIEIDSMT